MNKGTVNQYCVVARAERSLLARTTQVLAREGLNIEGQMTETVGSLATFRFLCDKDNGIRKKLEDAGFLVIEEKVFCLEMANRPGELNQLAKMLMAAEIEIRYLYATSHGRTTKVVLAVDKVDAASDIVEHCSAAFAAK